MSEVFRVEKTRDFTVMSNRHLRDSRLSLKGKGLLSLILSLPDNWEYSVKGFSKLGPDGQDSIRTALKELTACGYVEVRRRRDEKGRLSVAEYTVYEIPKQESPEVGNPELVKPKQENPAQLSTEVSKTNEERTDLINNPSIIQDRMDEMEAYRYIISENIDYEYLIDRGYSKERLDEIIEIMLECVCSSRSILIIGQEEIPKEIVKSRMLKVNSSHMEYIFASMDRNPAKIRNIKAYMRSVIYNSVSTISSFYSAEANHDLYGTD